MSDELWLARVFRSDAARGSSVALVIPGASTPPSLSSLADDLDAETTAFLIPGADRCSLIPFARDRQHGGAYAAMLAAEAVLRARGQAGPVLTFDLPAGPGSVRRDERAWASLPQAPLALSDPDSPLAWVLGRDAPRTAPGRIAQGPRDRTFVQAVEDPAALALLDLPQAQAWAYLRHEGLSALCLYAWTGAGELSVRVFESATGGREAVASAEALPALWAALGEGARPERLRILQGRGPARARGSLLLRRDGETEAPVVGGDVRLLGRGQVLIPAAASRRAC